MPFLVLYMGSITGRLVICIGIKMEERLEKYLEKVSTYLKSIPISERVDIINEIKSHMEELHYKNNLNPEEIISQLGDEKELAQAYIGDAICDDKKFKWSKLLMIFSFYSLTGITGMFILPIFGVLAAALPVCSIIAIVAGAIKTIGYFIGFDVPFVMFQIGAYNLHPIFVLPASIVLGAFLFLCGYSSWKLILKYIQSVSKHKKLCTQN